MFTTECHGLNPGLQGWLGQHTNGATDEPKVTVPEATSDLMPRTPLWCREGLGCQVQCFISGLWHHDLVHWWLSVCAALTSTRQALVQSPALGGEHYKVQVCVLQSSEDFLIRISNTNTEDGKVYLFVQSFHSTLYLHITGGGRTS